MCCCHPGHPVPDQAGVQASPHTWAGTPRPYYATHLAAGIGNVWVQQGGESPELIKLGEDLNLNMVAGKCILMYATPVRGFIRVAAAITPP